jgi:hypothetical protein
MSVYLVYYRRNKETRFKANLEDGYRCCKDQTRVKGQTRLQGKACLQDQACIQDQTRVQDSCLISPCINFLDMI